MGVGGQSEDNCCSKFVLRIEWNMEINIKSKRKASSFQAEWLQFNKPGSECVCVCVCVCVYARSGVSDSLRPPWTVAHQASLYMGFSRQEYWSGLPFPTPGDLSDPGIEPTSLVPSTLAGRFFTTNPPRKPISGWGTALFIFYQPKKAFHSVSLF